MGIFKPLLLCYLFWPTAYFEYRPGGGLFRGRDAASACSALSAKSYLHPAPPHSADISSSAVSARNRYGLPHRQPPPFPGSSFWRIPSLDASHVLVILSVVFLPGRCLCDRSPFFPLSQAAQGLLSPLTIRIWAHYFCNHMYFLLNLHLWAIFNIPSIPGRFYQIIQLRQYVILQHQRVR